MLGSKEKNLVSQLLFNCQTSENMIATACGKPIRICRTASVVLTCLF